MLTITPRLGTLAAKYRGATRTAKDGQEYSQLVFEAENLEVTDVEVNAIFNNPNAFRAIKALHAAVPGIKSIEVESKIEGAFVSVRLGAVNAANGSMYEFNDSVVDNLTLGKLESDSLSCDFRVVTKPALNGQFGELISRMGHTAMIGVNAISPNAQVSLPLNGAATGPGDDEDDEDEGATPATLSDALKADAKCRHGVSMDVDCTACLDEQNRIGTPTEERDKAQTREQQIAAELSAGRTHADDAIGDGKTTAELLAKKTPRRKTKNGAGAHAAH